MKISAEGIARYYGSGDEKTIEKGWLTYCPCHSDDDVNLRVWDTSYGPRCKCLAGCKTSTVLEELENQRLVPTAKTDITSYPNVRPGDIEHQIDSETLAHYEGLISQHTYGLAGFLNKEIPKPKHYISPIVRESSISLWYAKAGEGKSWASMTAALLATRRDYHKYSFGNWDVHNPCGVLLADGELPGADLQNRLRLLSKPLGPEHPDHPLIIFPTDELSIKSGHKVNLGDEIWRQAIKNTLEKNTKVKLLIVDNIASFTPGVNENTKGAWDPINQWLLDLRRMGVAVILIHHSNKAGGNRGHSCHVDNIDVEICLKRVGINIDTVRFEMGFVKGRNLEPGEGDTIELELVGNDEDGLRLMPVDKKEFGGFIMGH